MYSIQKQNLNSPSSLNFNISNYLFEKHGGADEIELLISIEQGKLNVKELSTYLELIYRLDGYLSNLGFSQYSHYPKGQIEIAEIRFGSLELIFKEILNSINAERLIIIGLALKYLPKVINSILDIGIKYLDFQNKREDYLEKRDKRKLRKDIRKIISDDETLQALDKKTREKLVIVLERLYGANARKIPASSRFASSSVKAVRIVLKKK